MKGTTSGSGVAYFCCCCLKGCIIFFNKICFATGKRKQCDVHLVQGNILCLLGKIFLGKNARKSVFFSYVMHGSPLASVRVE